MGVACAFERCLKLPAAQRSGKHRVGRRLNLRLLPTLQKPESRIQPSLIQQSAMSSTFDDLTVM